MKKLLSKISCPIDALVVKASEPSSFIRSETYADRVEQLWNQMLSEKQTLEITLWNSELYRFENFSENSSTPTLEVSLVETKDVLLFQQFREKYKQTPSSWPLNLFVAGVIKTNDDLFLVGELSGKSLRRKGKLDLIGGALSSAECVLTSGIDILNHLTKELHEEVGIPQNEVNNANFLCLLRTEVLSIGLILELNLSISSEQVSDYFNGPHDDELSDVKRMTRDEFTAFLNQNNTYLNLLTEFYK